jgi:hypothetical protein
VIDERVDEYGRVWIVDPDMEPGLYEIRLGNDEGAWRTVLCRGETPGEAILLAEAQDREIAEEYGETDWVEGEEGYEPVALSGFEVRSIRHGPVAVPVSPPKR